MNDLKNNQANTDITSQAVSGTAWLTIANLVTLVLGLVLIMVSTRKFSPDVYGKYILLSVIAGLLIQLSTLGFGLTIPRFLAISEEAERKELLVNTFLTLRLIAFLGMTIIAVLIFPLLFILFHLARETIVVVFIIMMFFLGGITSTMQSTLQGFSRFKEIAIWDILSSSLNLILLFVLFDLAIDGLTILVCSYLIAYLIADIYMYTAIPVRKHFVLEFSLIKEVIKFGFPLQLNDILSYIYNQINTFMIAAMLPAADIAYFSVVGKIPDSLLTFFDSYTTVFFPLFSHLHSSQEREKAEFLLSSALRVTTLIGLFMAGIVLLFGKDLIQLLFSDKYTSAAPLFFVLMVALVLNMIGYLLGKSLVAVGESDKPAKINLAHAAVGLSLNWVLIPILGIFGVGIANVAGPAVTNPLNYFFLTRKFPIHILSSYLKPLAIFTVWAALIYFLHFDALWFKVAALFFYLLINSLFSVITKDDYVFARGESVKVLREIAYRFVPRKSKQL